MFVLFFSPVTTRLYETLELIKHLQNKKGGFGSQGKCEPKEPHNQVLCNIDVARLCLPASWPNCSPCSYLMSRKDTASDTVKNGAMENH